MREDSDDSVLARRKERLRSNSIRGWHHHAVRTKDMTATRAFYEGVLQLPLVGTWTEAYDVIKKTPSNYVHCFFELGDGSALAFFQFEEGMREEPMPMPRDPYEHHVSLGVDTMETVDYFRKRIEEAGAPVEIVDHGYCYSCYTQDPNGMVVEISTIVPNGIEILEQSAVTAETDLKNWLAGVHDSNNQWRGKTKI
jgi:glyoxylase I family protein